VGTLLFSVAPGNPVNPPGFFSASSDMINAQATAAGSYSGSHLLGDS
jgi:hypothetical protein